MRFGARTTLLPGLVLVAVALAPLTRAPVDGGYVQHVLRWLSCSASAPAWNPAPRPRSVPATHSTTPRRF
jgi:hypothetical protein